MTSIVARLAGGSAMKPLRSAEAMPTWPGFKIGFELGLIPPADINQMGDGSGTLPTMNPVPRLYLCKGLFFDTELIFSLFPSSVVNTINTSGLIFKWSYMDEKQGTYSGSLFLGMTSISAFNRQFLGSDIELGAILSKDYVRVRPYAGLGLMKASGEFPSGILQTPTTTSASATLIHLFVGAEFNLPVNFTAQVDFYNLNPALTVFTGKRF